MRWSWALLADFVVVLAFVLIGRRSHDEAGAVLGVLDTLWPFGAGLLLGWLIARAWRRPARVWPTGVVVWVSVVTGGVVLRLLTGEGAPFTFLVVTSVFLGVFLLGWRAVALRVRRGREARTTVQSAVR